MTQRGEAEVGVQRIRREEDGRQSAGKLAHHGPAQKKRSQHREGGEDRIHQEDCRWPAEFVRQGAQVWIAERVLPVITSVVRQHVIAADELARVIQHLS